MLKLQSTSTPVTAVVEFQDGTERVVPYLSEALAKVEVDYSMTEKECLVVCVITMFRSHLYEKLFSVIADHHTVRVGKPQEFICVPSHFGLRLQKYDITMSHDFRGNHGDADCLSPVLQSSLPS